MSAVGTGMALGNGGPGVGRGRALVGAGSWLSPVSAGGAVGAGSARLPQCRGCAQPRGCWGLGAAPSSPHQAPALRGGSCGQRALLPTRELPSTSIGPGGDGLSPWYLPPVTEPSPHCPSVCPPLASRSAVPSPALPVFQAAAALSPLSRHLSWATTSQCHVGQSCSSAGAGDRTGGGPAAPCPGCPGAAGGLGAPHSPAPCGLELCGCPSAPASWSPLPAEGLGSGKVGWRWGQ